MIEIKDLGSEWQIDLRLRFAFPKGEFKAGDVSLVDDAGQVLYVPPRGPNPAFRFVWDLCSLLAALCWLRPKDQKVFFDEGLKDNNSYVQAWHKVYMQSKYPGWPEASLPHPDTRPTRPRAEPVENVKTEKSIEELDL